MIDESAGDEREKEKLTANWITQKLLKSFSNFLVDDDVKWVKYAAKMGQDGETCNGIISTHSLFINLSRKLLYTAFRWSHSGGSEFLSARGETFNFQATMT